MVRTFSDIRPFALVPMRMCGMSFVMPSAVLHMQDNRFTQANTAPRALTLLFP